MHSKSSSFHVEYVDDSIHGMLERERRQALKRGEEPKGYRPRASLPVHLLQTSHVTEYSDDDEEDDIDDDLVEAMMKALPPSKQYLQQHRQRQSL